MSNRRAEKLFWIFQSNITYFVTFRNTKIIKTNFLSFWRKRKNVLSVGNCLWQINLRKVWAIIKQFVDRKNSSKVHDKFIHNKKSDGFNNYFVNIGPTLASTISDDNLSRRQFLPASIKPSLFIETWISIWSNAICRSPRFYSETFAVSFVYLCLKECIHFHANIFFSDLGEGRGVLRAVIRRLLGY